MAEGRGNLKFVEMVPYIGADRGDERAEALVVAENNGAYIHHINDKEYYTRIKLQPGMQ